MIEGDVSRTQQQNRALHLYFRQVAKALMEAGYTDMREILKPTVEIPPNEYMVKETMWKPVQEIMTGEDSTADAGKKGVSEVYEVFSHFLATRFGVHVEFPREDQL